MKESRIGKYRIDRELGRGGMGVVYKAWDEGLKRPVALKILSSTGEGEDLARFQREAQTAASLKHPNIVGVYEVGQQEGKHFIAMEFVEGRTLVGEKVTPRRAAEIVAQVAEAVDYAHSKGVIHRDLKPHNIMIDGAGKPSVMDFGLAKSLRGESQITVSGTLVGTPSYMSPEQAQGKLHQIDKRSDVYSLGAVLYELLTERPPFKSGSPLETLRLVIEVDPMPPSKLVRVTPDLETIVMKCLEKDKTRRYPSARLLADDLKRWLKGESIAARPISMVTQARKKLSKSKVPAIATAVAVLAILLVFVVVHMTRSADHAEALRQKRIGDAAFEKEEYAAALAAYERMVALEYTDENLERADRCRARVKEEEKKARSQQQAPDRAQHEDIDKADEERKKAEEEKNRRAEARKQAQGEYDAGQQSYEEARRDWYRPTADLSRLHPRMIEAIARFDAAIKTFPEYQEAFLARGLAKAVLHRHAEAVDDFTESIRLLKTSSASYYARARAYIDLANAATFRVAIEGDPARKCEDEFRAKARADLEEYRKLSDPGSEETQFAEAFMAYSERRPQEAIRICDVLIARATSNEEVFKLKGHALEMLGGADNTRRAEECFTQAIAKRVNWAEVYIERGIVRQRLGRTDAAIEDFTRAIAIDSLYSLGYLNRGVLYWSRGKDPEALADFQRASELAPGDALVWHHMGAVYMEMGRLEKALSLVEKAIKINPSAPHFYGTRGAIKRRLNDLDGAMEDFNKDLDLDPRDRVTHYNRGLLHERLGHFDDAVRDFQAYVDGNPTDVRGYYSLGQAHSGAGRHRDAIQCWKKCLELGIGDRAAIEKMIADEAKK